MIQEIHTIQLTDSQRIRLEKLGKRLGLKAPKEVAASVKSGAIFCAPVWWAATRESRATAAKLRTCGIVEGKVQV